MKTHTCQLFPNFCCCWWRLAHFELHHEYVFFSVSVSQHHADCFHGYNSKVCVRGVHMQLAYCNGRCMYM